MTHRVLLVEDGLADARLVQHRLRTAASDPTSFAGEEWRLERVAALMPAVDRLGQGRVDVVLLDLGLPDGGGLETLARLREVDANVPIVVLTGCGDEALGLRALEAGAQDHLVESEVACSRALLRSLRYAIERSRLGDQREAMAQQLAEAQKMESLWTVAAGTGRAYDHLLERILEELDLCFGEAGDEMDAGIRAHLTRIRRTALEGEEISERLRGYAEAARGRGARSDLPDLVLAPAVAAPGEPPSRCGFQPGATLRPHEARSARD